MDYHTPWLASCRRGTRCTRSVETLSPRAHSTATLLVRYLVPKCEQRTVLVVTGKCFLTSYAQATQYRTVSTGLARAAGRHALRLHHVTLERLPVPGTSRTVPIPVGNYHSVGCYVISRDTKREANTAHRSVGKNTAQGVARYTSHHTNVNGCTAKEPKPTKVMGANRSRKKMGK